MDLPVLSFDIGAQGEKTKKYSKGIICKDSKDMYEKIELLNLMGNFKKYKDTI